MGHDGPPTIRLSCIETFWSKRRRLSAPRVGACWREALPTVSVVVEIVVDCVFDGLDAPWFARGDCAG